MPFVILYFVPAILFLTNTGLFKIAGTFLCICYLPGLFSYVFIQKDSLEFEDLVLAFPVSIGVSSLLTLGLLYFGVHVKLIAYIIYLITGLALFLYVAKNKKLPSITIKLSRGEISFIIIAFLMTLLFSIPVISERIAISQHGFHHLSIVTGIFNGFFPPDNPGMGSTAIGYHWGYHALVAAISSPADFHPLRVFSVLNIMSLFFIFCIAFRSAKSFGIAERYCYLVPLALIGLMRADAAIFYFQNLITGNFPPVQSIASAPHNLLSSWVSGVSFLDTRLFFMNKFYNANNMPIGLCLIFSFFLIQLLLLEEQIEHKDRKMYLAILAVILIALAITYAFFLIIPLIFVPVWACVLYATQSGSYRKKISESLNLIIPCAIAALIVSPYLLIIASSSNVATAGTSTGEFRFIYVNIQTIKNLIVFLLPSPFIILGFLIAFKRLTLSRRFLFLLSGSLAFLLLSIFLRFRWYNSAKFSYVLSFFFAFLFVFAVQYLLSLLTNKWIKSCFTILFAAFLLAAPIMTEAAYIFSPWFLDTTYAFSGRHVIYAQNKSRNEAYTWIRDNTPADSLLVLPYFDTPYGITIANTISYRPAALSERSLFVVKDVYAYLLPEYEVRVEIRTQLFENPGNIKVKKYLASINRPVYLLEEDGYEDPILEGVELDRVPEDSGEELLLVYKNDRQRIYRVEYKN